MKTRCELTEPELRKLLKVKKIKLNFPRTQDKWFYLLCLMSLMVIMTSSVLFHSMGYDKGRALGYDSGYAEGYSAQLNPNYEGLTLSGAIAFNIKHNLDDYIAWFGLVVGLGWVIHGVGFRLAG